jgi:hypothetical protein
VGEKKEYIERGTLLNILNAIYEECRLNDDGATSDLALDVIRHIEDQPAADVVEVRHGHWIIKTDEYGNEYMMCSCCKDEFYPVDADTVDSTPNYCPNCGAKMDGERKDNP